MLMGGSMVLRLVQFCAAPCMGCGLLSSVGLLAADRSDCGPHHAHPLELEGFWCVPDIQLLAWVW